MTSKGVKGKVNDEGIALGYASMMEILGVESSILHYSQQANTWRTEGKTDMFAPIGNKFAGLITVSDPVKNTTQEEIDNLQTAGLKIIMATAIMRLLPKRWRTN